MTGDRLFVSDVALPLAAARTAQDRAPQVDLVIESDGMGRSWLRRQRAAYPFHIGRTWHVPGDPPEMLTFYVQSSAGGIFQGDDLRWQLRAETGAMVHITTAASTIVHRMDAGSAAQCVELHAAGRAVVEYLPDPLILFRGARLRNALTVHAEPDAIVMVWDMLIPHDPTGQGGCFDWLASDTSIQDHAGRLLARDRYRLDGHTFAAQLPGVTGSWKCQGAFFVVQGKMQQRELVKALRDALPAMAGAYAGAGTLPSDCGAWVRVLARDAVLLRERLSAAWYAARRLLLGSAPALRRK